MTTDLAADALSALIPGRTPWGAWPRWPQAPVDGGRNRRANCGPGRRSGVADDDVGSGLPGHGRALSRCRLRPCRLRAREPAYARRSAREPYRAARPGWQRPERARLDRAEHGCRPRSRGPFARADVDRHAAGGARLHHRSTPRIPAAFMGPRVKELFSEAADPAQSTARSASDDPLVQTMLIDAHLPYLATEQQILAFLLELPMIRAQRMPARM